MSKLNEDAVEKRDIAILKTYIDDACNPVFLVSIKGKEVLFSKIEMRIKYPIDYARYLGSLLRFNK